MRILLDTNIIIYREANTIIHSEIGVLFGWLDKLGYIKCIHPLTLDEIRKNPNQKTVDTFEKKLANYHLIKTIANDTAEIEELRNQFDHNENDHNDSTLLNELASGRVDYFITEDRKLHKKAAYINLDDKVFTIDGFLEKVVSENPNFADYKVLSVKKEYFGNIPLHDNFFDTFREDYPGFDKWFIKKSDEFAYYCKNEDDEVAAFLFLKVEDSNEAYHDIFPAFPSKKRLKIGTFKVVSNGFKLGERFIKIIFDNAFLFNVEEVYVTIFNHGDNKLRLIKLLKDWGFVEHGVKRSAAGEEIVLVRPFGKAFAESVNEPRLRYPFMLNNVNKWLVPIYPAYHTELFPDSILNNESPKDYIELRPNRNALSKVYISRSYNKSMQKGDLVVFYRTACGGSAWYTSVATTIGVVESVITDIKDEKHFIELCRKRSVFTDKEISEFWNFNKTRPFIVNFLYLYSFPKRMNLQSLVENGIIANAQSAPRGFETLSADKFEKLLGGSHVDRSIVID
ncbi:PIN domain-containing protein [Acinetobacter pittii]|uniref:PIN domain-containing protein n=1 Tax=Acinetobacter pittii TaxID=48296 RepID=UPI00132FBB4F|nr:PIN domain-containing protein [Acinetobacter pittii]